MAVRWRLGHFVTGLPLHGCSWFTFQDSQQQQDQVVAPGSRSRTANSIKEGFSWFKLQDYPLRLYLLGETPCICHCSSSSMIVSSHYNLHCLYSLGSTVGANCSSEHADQNLGQPFTGVPLGQSGILLLIRLPCQAYHLLVISGPAEIILSQVSCVLPIRLHSR